MQDIKMVDLKGQYQHIKLEVDAAIQQVIDTSSFIKGPAVKRFSDNLASYLNVKNVIPCANGTDALLASLMALDLQPGDEVITTSFSFVATVEVVKSLGLQLIFADIDPETYNIDGQDVLRKITKATRCIIPVHLFGAPANLDPYFEIAKEKGIHILEDNAQSIGSKINIRNNKGSAGCLGDIGTTSFFPSKNLGCYGDGGAIFTNNDALAHKVRQIVNHGGSVKYHYERIGMNSRLDSIQAAVLDVKLQYLEDYIEKRRTAAKLYHKLLEDENRVIRPILSDQHVFHQYTLRIPSKRDEIKAFLKDHSIPTAIYYPKCLHLHKPYDQNVSLPHSELATTQVLSLPMHTELETDQQEYIVNHIKKALDFFL